MVTRDLQVAEGAQVVVELLLRHDPADRRVCLAVIGVEVGRLRADADEVGCHRGVQHFVGSAQGIDGDAVPIRDVGVVILGPVEVRVGILRIPLVAGVARHVGGAQGEVRHEELLLLAVDAGGGANHSGDAAAEGIGAAAGGFDVAVFRVAVGRAHHGNARRGAGREAIGVTRHAGRHAVVGLAGGQAHGGLPVFVRDDQVRVVGVVVAIHWPASGERMETQQQRLVDEVHAWSGFGAFVFERGERVVVAVVRGAEPAAVGVELLTIVGFVAEEVEVPGLVAADAGRPGVLAREHVGGAQIRHVLVVGTFFADDAAIVVDPTGITHREAQRVVDAAIGRREGLIRVEADQRVE